jgi:hypothetical protein
MSDLFSLNCCAHFAIGQGRMTVQNGTVYGIPALILAPAEHVGVTGEDAENIERSAADPEVMRRSVVLTFKSEEHRDAVQAAFLGVAK